MNFRKRCFAVLPMILMSVSLFSQSGTKYFDNNWKETTKEEASFYRPQPLFVDSGYIVKDYYINTKQLQGVGFSKTGGDKDFTGEVVWYHPNGAISQKAVLTEGTFNGPISNYNEEGQLLSSGVFLDGNPHEGSFFTDYGNYYLVSNYKNGQPSHIVMTDAVGDSKAKIEGFYYETGSISRIDYYDQNGKMIGSGSKTDEYLSVTDGIEVSYAFAPMSVSYIIRLKNSQYDGPITYYYSTGQIKKKEYYNYTESEESDGEQEIVAQVFYDKYGKQLDSLAYINGYPQNGLVYTFFTTDSATVNDQIESITPYKDGEINGTVQTFDNNGHLLTKAEYINGSIVGEKLTYDAKGNVKYRMTYKDGSPWEGTSNDYGYIYEYVQGELVKETELYLNGSPKCVTQNLKESKIKTVYSPNGEELGKLTVDGYYSYQGNDYVFEGDDISEINIYKNNEIVENKKYYKGKLLVNKTSNGISTFVDISDNRKYTCEYRNNEPWTGTVLDYSYYNEYVSSKSEYKDGKLNGEYIEYDTDSETDSVVTTLIQNYKDGELDGISKTFKAGKLIKSETYNNGVIDGEVIGYEDDEIVAKAEYRSGAPWSGKVIEYDYYNEIESVSQYTDGLLEGEKISYASQLPVRKEYYSNGVITKMITYCPFVPDSVLELNYVDGEPHSGKTYLSNAIDEYVDGNIKSTVNYDVDGSGDVVCRKIYNGSKCQETSYYADGKIKQKRELEDNTPVGVALTYDDKGKVITQGKYESGVPVSGTFAFFNTYDETDYLLLTIAKQTVSIEPSKGSENAFKYSATLSSKNQSMSDLVREFIEMIHDKNYNYDLPYLEY